jgi:hypothetical protein
MKRLHGFWLTLAVLVALSGPPAKSAFAQDKQARAEAVEVKIDPRPALFAAVTVPARSGLCGLNSWLASIFLTFSAGMRYADAAQMMESGCAGSWVVTPEMIDQAGPPPAAQKRAVWEIDNLR